MARTRRSRLIAANGDASISLPIEDRISNLPRGVIGSILERLTTREVARTSVLSRRWKHFWDTHHKLVLDQSFYQGLKSIDRNNSSKYLKRVTDILTIHQGSLQRFEFYFKSRQTLDVDLLILMVSRKHVQELVLTNNYRDLDTNYQLPSYLYLCQELTHLQLNHFYMARHPPLEFEGFPKLHTLVLELFRFSPHFGQIISNLPKLGTMSLMTCMSLPYIERLPESLHTLSVRFTPDFDWSMFRQKTNVTTFVLRWFRCIVPVRQNGMENFNMMTFLDNIPCMESLSLDGFALKNLAKDVKLNQYINGVKVCACALKTLIIWDVDFRNLDTVTCLLSLLRSTCILESLEIEGSFSRVTGAEPAVKCMKDEAEKGEKMKLEKLESVSLKRLNSLHTEKYLMKLLYAQTPSLKKMSMEFRKGIGMMRQAVILEETPKYPRASKVVHTDYIFPY